MKQAWVGSLESILLSEEESSNISEASYDHIGSLLTLTFRAGGVYTYENVPVQTWNGLKNAESKGKYFHRHIRGFFTSEKVPL